MNRWLRPIHAPSAVTAKVTRACTTPRNQTLPYRRQSCAAFSDNNSSRPQRSHPCFFGSKLFSKKQRNEPPLPRRVEGSGEAETLFEKSLLSPALSPKSSANMHSRNGNMLARTIRVRGGTRKRFASFNGGACG